jgi:hypothetical protein
MQNRSPIQRHAFTFRQFLPRGVAQHLHRPSWINMDCSRWWNVDDQYLAAKQPHRMPRQQALDTQHPLITRVSRLDDEVILRIRIPRVQDLRRNIVQGCKLISREKAT